MSAANLRPAVNYAIRTAPLFLGKRQIMYGHLSFSGKKYIVNQLQQSNYNGSRCSQDNHIFSRTDLFCDAERVAFSELIWWIHLVALHPYIYCCRPD